MWKNDRFFEEQKITFSTKIGKTYAGNVVLADTGGKYINYCVELPKK